MKNIFLIFLLSISVNTHAQKYIKYEGMISNLPITMFLTENDILDNYGTAVGTQWDGYYFYNNVKKAIKLKGSFNAMGMGGSDPDREDYIYEYNGDKETGMFISSDFSGLPVGINGQWESSDGMKKYDFFLIQTQ